MGGAPPALPHAPVPSPLARLPMSAKGSFEAVAAGCGGGGCWGWWLLWNALALIPANGSKPKLLLNWLLAVPLGAFAGWATPPKLSKFKLSPLSSLLDLDD